VSGPLLLQVVLLIIQAELDCLEGPLRVLRLSRKNQRRSEVEISAYNLIFHELIGLFTEVINSNNPSLEKIRGKVVGETKNMLIVETYDYNEKMVPKSGSTFLFHIPLLRGDTRVTEQVKVNGNLLLSQPENRIKNIRKIRMR